MTPQHIIEAIKVTMSEMPIDTVADEMLRQFMRSVVARAQRYEACADAANLESSKTESTKWYVEYGHNCNTEIHLVLGSRSTHGFLAFHDTPANRYLMEQIKQAHNREKPPGNE